MFVLCVAAQLVGSFYVSDSLGINGIHNICFSLWPPVKDACIECWFLDIVTE
jgi:hypothetical protein